MSTLEYSLPGINHLALCVADVPASLRFYDVLLPLLGWRPRRSPESTGYVAGNTELYLQAARELDGPPRRYRVGLQHLALNASTRELVDTVYQRVQELGVEVTDPPAEYPHYAPGYYAVFFKDPSGLHLEVCHAPGLGH